MSMCIFCVEQFNQYNAFSVRRDIYSKVYSLPNAKINIYYFIVARQLLEVLFRLLGF